MAQNMGKVFLYNEITGSTSPLIKLLKRNTGVPIFRGEICKFGGTYMAPLAADEAMDSVLAVCNEEIRSVDPLGYYEFIIPRVGDVFEYPLVTPSALAWNAPLYASSTGYSQVLTPTPGTNIIGYSCADDNIPHQQTVRSGNGNKGSTLETVSTAKFTFVSASSYWDVIYR